MIRAGEQQEAGIIINEVRERSDRWMILGLLWFDLNQEVGKSRISKILIYTVFNRTIVLILTCCSVNILITSGPLTNISPKNG